MNPSQRKRPQIGNAGGVLLVPTSLLLFGLTMPKAAGTSPAVIAVLVIPTTATHSTYQLAGGRGAHTRHAPSKRGDRDIGPQGRYHQAAGGLGRFSIASAAAFILYRLVLWGMCATIASTHAGCCCATGCAGRKCSACGGVRSTSTPASVRRGRVAVGAETVEGAPKSRRSRRDLPLPAELTEALRALRTRQKQEALALGVAWSDDRLVAADQAGTPLRPEFYTDEFQRLRTRAGLRRIKLHAA